MSKVEIDPDKIRVRAIQPVMFEVYEELENGTTQSVLITQDATKAFELYCIMGYHDPLEKDMVEKLVITLFAKVSSVPTWKEARVN